MESARLNGFFGAFLSVLFGIAPDLAAMTTFSDLVLKWLSICSVLLILILNIKKLRNNAPA